MAAYTYFDLIDAKLEELNAMIQTDQIILDTLRLTMPWTKQQETVWMNTWDALQGRKGYRRDLISLRKSLGEVTQNV